MNDCARRTERVDREPARRPQGAVPLGHSPAGPWRRGLRGATAALRWLFSNVGSDPWRTQTAGAHPEHLIPQVRGGPETGTSEKPPGRDAAGWGPHSEDLCRGTGAHRLSPPATGTRRTAGENMVHTRPLGSSGAGSKGRILGRHLLGLTLGPLGSAEMADPEEAAAALRGWPPRAPLRGGKGSELPAAGL